MSLLKKYILASVFNASFILPVFGSTGRREDKYRKLQDDAVLNLFHNACCVFLFIGREGAYEDARTMFIWKTLLFCHVNPQNLIIYYLTHSAIDDLLCKFLFCFGFLKPLQNC
jgi:hypothetical protein